MKLQQMNVTIVGLGLMGASLARALRGQVASITGVDSDQAALNFAQQNGIVENAATSLAELAEGSDLLVLAVPVDEILGILRQIGSRFHSPRRLIDLGSTKVEIVQAMEALPASVEAIGGHPLCGKEQAGIQASDPGLFRDCNFALTPLANSSNDSPEWARELIEAVGARPLILDPAKHDRLLALSSHLPYLVSAGLAGTINKAATRDHELEQVLASGFIDTSRLAGSDVRMIGDTLLTNQRNVLDALHQFKAIVAVLESLIESGDRQQLYAHLRSIQSWRQRLPAGGTG